MTTKQPNDKLIKPVEIIDCTLRDGEQAPGVWLTVQEKLALAKLLSQAGVDVLDAGFPASSPADMEAMQEMVAAGLRARIAATARPLARDIVAAEMANAHEVFMFLPTSALRMEQTLGITRDQAISLFCSGAEEVCSRGMTLNLVFEDATRSRPEMLTEIVRQVHAQADVRRVILADTVGCAIPAAMEALTRTVRSEIDADIVVTPHCHNDFGLAVANTLAAVSGGAGAVTCTVNGIGERAGNADLAETVAGLSLLLQREHGVDPHQLVALQEAVEIATGIHQSPTKPVTGINVFRHESGIHVDGMLKDPRSYEFLPASWVGRRSEYILGKHSGTSLIRRLAHMAGLDCDEHTASLLLAEVKAATQQRDKSEHQRAFQLKQAFEAVALSGISPFTVLLRLRQGVSGVGRGRPSRDGAAAWAAREPERVSS
ncbi:LeuA family protein [Haliangium ochraceum]|uniref:2-isopropylmalate synthase n=1 Tax=Haliangium ochraceum (strain DSM 14365 / JCM 11303 / SMP-2) TaxID=502025 RepID=D0LNR8_HALO1|nr:pyruvate carboxyltransferase [Haliangium ochraceum]ACY16973.1 pyruvate carboxyltransferase [Haliangium ochraceum DSM 14365]